LLLEARPVAEEKAFDRKGRKGSAAKNAKKSKVKIEVRTPPEIRIPSIEILHCTCLRKGAIKEDTNVCSLARVVRPSAASQGTPKNN
jgi:hypothetical protein